MVEVSNISYIFANYKFQLHQTAKKTYSLSTEKIDKKDTKEFKAVRPQGRGWELPKPTKYYGFPEQIKTYYQNIGFLADFQLEVEKLFSRMYYLGPLRDYPKRQYSWAGSQKQAIGSKGEYVIEALLASRKDIKSQIKISPRKKQSIEEYVAHWLKELELIYDFRVEELAEGSNLYQVKVRKTPESSEVLITDVGFGVSQILPVITLCFYAPEHSILIMEQPEIHLHPKVQAGLADVFIDAIKKRNIQIIIESHSEHLLTRMQRRIAEEDVSNKDIQMYFCESINGQSELKHLDIDLFGNIANWPDNFFGNEMEEKFAIAEAQFKRISANGIQ
jgi:predicted ATPase